MSINDNLKIGDSIYVDEQYSVVTMETFHPGLATVSEIFEIKGRINFFIKEIPGWPYDLLRLIPKQEELKKECDQTRAWC